MRYKKNKNCCAIYMQEELSVIYCVWFYLFTNSYILCFHILCFSYVSIVPRFSHKYDITVHSEDPWVVTFDNFLSDE